MVHIFRQILYAIGGRIKPVMDSPGNDGVLFFRIYYRALFIPDSRKPGSAPLQGHIAGIYISLFSFS